MFFGQKNNANEYLQAMDIFLITSYNEGLCISAIESQFSGMPTFVSDGVPDECRISGCFIKMAPGTSAKEWADTILSTNLKRSSENDLVSENAAEYDISASGKKLEEFYINISR